MFSNGKWHKNVTTVGEMVQELSLLDPDIPVKEGFSDSVDIVVFNRDGDDIQVGFDEGGEWGEDAVSPDEDEDD